MFQRYLSSTKSVSQKQSQDHVVPTVDISPFLKDSSSTAATEVVETIRKACLSTGFFQITGHGISKEVQDAAFAASAKFFSLPVEEKLKVHFGKHPGHRGYDPIGSQKYDDSLPDLKESYFTGPEVPLDHPAVQAKRFNMGPNVWPSTSVLPKESFQDPVETYFRDVYGLSLAILDIIAQSLPYGPRIFDEFKSGIPAAPMRLLHYPPQEALDKRQLGASAHTDFGAITLLLQDMNGGLQVQDQATKEWIGVPPVEGAFVVNVGDMLSMWTKGVYKSSWHRVINRNSRDRYSIVLFFDGNIDCSLAPLDGSESTGSPTVEEHMIKRITDSYGKA
ncbi:uncharacterized protein K452DRAFT_303432 [Aplosporella prunicola CBS 121167]|uniref:Fe2OG dioxygenase domain-containing protein n=1 Tax=Aplosporella prunicola CBS 121167 TaxID=1176127 RepID=A0A6A6AXD2_9PEZI|nr:uncharacterized protein K452DRAFT_303432 [Aplosporella prunicola CBS 121167]KAF2135594.1 hypothetical protein K452DRAFT_303432 [Aplosporella prunicola CBS 121167]